MSDPRPPLFLLEIGTEEIPDRMLAAAERDLLREVRAALEPLEILEPDAAWRAFSTPRRLAVQVGPVRPRQEDREELATGPSVKVAFDAGGAPTRAALGFARGQGVEVAALERIRTEKGEYVAVRKQVTGRPAVELLAGACPDAVDRLRFPKMMRWGEGPFRFVRPIRWMASLLDGEVAPFQVAGVSAGRISHGARGREPVELPSAAAYVERLAGAGVEVDPSRRREIIAAGLQEEAAAAGGRLLPDDDLLEILVNMTELPSVIHGEFPPEYLELPREVLVTAMRHHQRYFSVLEPEGERLRPAFLAVLNRRDDPAGLIRRGHEWVLQARLADARFFWEEDGKASLESRLEDLDRVIFQEKLGSFRAKVGRMESLADRLGERMGVPEEERRGAARAARLSKCDLTTAMVGEFPELQGVMGGIYARRDGEPGAIADAIYDHYRPAPRSPTGVLLGLADRLDTLAGCFALGMEPTGTRDPLALRRAALGVARMLWENPWYLSLRAAIDEALAGLPPGGRQAEDPAARLHRFLLERLRHVALDAAHRYDSVAAVLAVQDDDIRDASRRLQALTGLRADPAHEEAFLSLSGASKRIRNILRGQGRGELDPETLVEPPEMELHRRLEEVDARLDGLLAGRDYPGSLREVASLRPAVDGFLGSSRSEGVLVMADEPRLRENRLALLRRAGDLFGRVADFSEIVVEGEAG